MHGTLALVGGAEWTDGCEADAELLAASGGSTVTVLPTAAAYERPDLKVAAAREWFAGLGAEVDVVEAYRRPHVFDEALIAKVRAAHFLYLASGTPMHLRSVLYDSPLWDAAVEAWQGGAVLAASGEAAAALSTHMVDPRGGAFTVGLGLLSDFTVVPRASEWSEDKWHRTLRLAPAGLDVVGIDARTALISEPSGWRVVGPGQVTVTRGGVREEVTDLPPLSAG